MKLVLSYFKMYFLNTVRNTPSLFFSLILPPLILLITHRLYENNAGSQWTGFIVFCNYSVQTVALMVLGMGVSNERHSPWSHFLRCLPTPISTMLLGRFLHIFCLSSLNLLSTTIVSLLFLHMDMLFTQWLYVMGIALLGAIPMALMGLTIGYVAGAESSRSVFTLLNMLFLFGSFSFPDTGFWGQLREVILSYQWNQLSLYGTDPSISIKAPLICLGAYSFVFLYLFSKVYRTKKGSYVKV